MGKSTISTAIFNSKLLVIARGYPRDSKSSKELVQTSQLPHSWTKNDKELFQEAHFQPYFVADFIWFHQLPKLAKDIEGRGPTSRCFWGCKNQSQFAEPPIESKIRPYKWLLVVFLAVKQTLLSWFPQSNTVCFNGTSPPFSMVKPLESLQVRALLIFIGAKSPRPPFFPSNICLTVWPSNKNLPPAANQAISPGGPVQVKAIEAPLLAELDDVRGEQTRLGLAGGDLAEDLAGHIALVPDLRVGSGEIENGDPGCFKQGFKRWWKT